MLPTGLLVLIIIVVSVYLSSRRILKVYRANQTDSEPRVISRPPATPEQTPTSSTVINEQSTYIPHILIDNDHQILQSIVAQYHCVYALKLSNQYIIFIQSQQATAPLHSSLIIYPDLIKILNLQPSEEPSNLMSTEIAVMQIKQLEPELLEIKYTPMEITTYSNDLLLQIQSHQFQHTTYLKTQTKPQLPIAEHTHMKSLRRTAEMKGMALPTHSDTSP